ncbi:MAG: sugar ABC transporter ATP-binding protein [Christensenellales bacterium]
MQENVPILELINITKTFPGVKALSNVTLRVNKGDTLGLVGENGAGKSTLMKILTGVYPMDSGEIILEGNPVKIHNPIDAASKGIAIIYQELSLIRQLNAVENMYLGVWKRNKLGLIDWKTMRQETKKVLNEFGMDFSVDVPVRQLSVAQCQMIEIIRAVSSGAKIIVMDEPTSSLTEKEVDLLFKMIKDLHSRNITVIYISHRLEELFHICNRVSVLKDGFNSGEFKIEEATMNKIITAMIGRTLDAYYPKRPGYVQNPEVVLKVDNVTLDNRVKGVSFEVHKGEILGFAGLVGAGRTEIMRSIFKAEKFATGDVYVNGKKVKIRQPSDAIKAGIAFSTEDRKNEGLILVFPVSHNVSMARIDRIANKIGLLNLKKENALAESYRNKLTIRTPSVSKRTMELSGGNQQKVVVAKWLNTDAKVYIFDEPTRGIDVATKAEIYQLMVDVAEAGNAVIMVSSELPEVLGVSDRIIVIHEGKITGEFTKAEATEEKVMHAAVGGIN